MQLSGEIEKRRASNARAMAAFGVKAAGVASNIRVIRDGGRIALYTVGYERRDGDGLISVLRDNGIRALADIRERPMSRKPDFRAGALRALCEETGIEYQPWPSLGSTAELREDLQESGDFGTFEKRFRALAERVMQGELDRLAKSVQSKPTVLLCYERCHEDCHRNVIAAMVADRIDATIIAIQ